MAITTVKKAKIKGKKDVVILPIREYKRLLAVPTHYLSGKEAEKLDKLVDEGLRDLREGRTIGARSLTEALKMYERKHKR